MSRPKITDVSYQEIAVELSRAVLEYGSGQNLSKESLIESLERAMKSAGTSGFQIAKELEQNDGFKPDSELVEILESSWFIRQTILSEQVTKWVTENNIQPSKLIEDEVFLEIRGEKCSGTITGIDYEKGQYTVCVAEHGHVREGQEPHGYLINYEDILQ